MAPLGWKWVGARRSPGVSADVSSEPEDAQRFGHHPISSAFPGAQERWPCVERGWVVSSQIPAGVSLISPVLLFEVRDISKELPSFRSHFFFLAGCCLILLPPNLPVTPSVIPSWFVQRTLETNNKIFCLCKRRRGKEN